ncbi:MAG TPA: hypothetical protein VH877_16745 [Polyangia bacterium]|nr:hypothetical protein [Polyangia bacterium]
MTAEDIAALREDNNQIAAVRSFLRPTRKLVRALEYIEANVDERRHKRLGAITTGLDRRAEVDGNEDLMLRYEKMRAYHSAIGRKAAADRMCVSWETGAALAGPGGARQGMLFRRELYIRRGRP